MSAFTDESSQLVLDFSVLPPRAEQFRRLLPRLAEVGFDRLIVEWDCSFPWAVDERMIGPGAFSEEAITGIMLVAERAGVSIFPRLARCGLISALDRVPGFSHIVSVASDATSLDTYASAAVRMVDRLVNDICSVIDAPEAMVLGHLPALDTEIFHNRFLDPVMSRLEDRAIVTIVEDAPGTFRDPVAPVEVVIDEALSDRGGREVGSELRAMVDPVKQLIRRFERFRNESWHAIRSAMELLVSASRDPGRRAGSTGASVVIERLVTIQAQCDDMRAECLAVLRHSLEAEIAADYVNRHLSPIEELTAATLVRFRSLG